MRKTALKQKTSLKRYTALKEKNSYNTGHTVIKSKENHLRSKYSGSIVKTKI